MWLRAVLMCTNLIVGILQIRVHIWLQTVSTLKNSVSFSLKPAEVFLTLRGLFNSKSVVIVLSCLYLRVSLHRNASRHLATAIFLSPPKWTKKAPKKNKQNFSFNNNMMVGKNVICCLANNIAFAQNCEVIALYVVRMSESHRCTFDQWPILFCDFISLVRALCALRLNVLITFTSNIFKKGKRKMFVLKFWISQRKSSKITYFHQVQLKIINSKLRCWNQQIFPRKNISKIPSSTFLIPFLFLLLTLNLRIYFK